MKKKRALTLLEVVIALALTSILLTVLLGSATRLFSWRHRLETAKKEVIAKKTVQQRLSTLFSSLEKHHSFAEDSAASAPPRSSLKSLSKNELIFYLDNLIDPDPDFSGKCKGVLLLEGQELVFKLFGKNSHERREVLLQGVTSFKIEFFDFTATPPRRVSLWKDEDDDLPPHIVVTIKASLFKKEESFAFFLSPSDNFVVYSPPIPLQGDKRK